MINIEMAEDYIERAKRYIREAERAFIERDFPTTVRRSQEALELGVKAVLRYLAIEYPREHDAGDALHELRNKVPAYLEREIPTFAELLSELARARGPAMYGYEREGIPVGKAFGENYAEEKLTEVIELLALCSRLIAGEELTEESRTVEE
jgi:HEPN domain-containing protein